MKRVFGLLILALFVLPLYAGQSIDPPSGHIELVRVLARGVQIYGCQATNDPARYEWVLRAPEADLFNAAGLLVGRHFAGPTWEWQDGSQVVGTRIAAATPDPTAIPWLLLRASSYQNLGLFTAVKYIQRINTVGGLAPAQGCDASHVGDESRVNYSAIYVFHGIEPPTVPDPLRVPDGHVVLTRGSAYGDQIYVCQATSDGQFAWVLRAPDAYLLDDDNNLLATHYAGPTWESVDGSRVVGMVVASAPAPVADAIPWLKLQAISHAGEGLFSTVTFIQRVNTMGGVAPTEGCDKSYVGTEARIGYTANYYFYIDGGPR